MQTTIIFYPNNRKLYSPDVGKYVNSEKVRKLIASGTKVKVLMHKTNEDVTQRVLMTILRKRKPTKQLMATMLKRVKELKV